MDKFFGIPFAASGDRTAIPTTADPGGLVSYPQGYGFDYQRQKTDPAALNIERDKMNQLFFDMSNAIREIQAQGVPDFITSALNGGSPYSYAIYAVVRYNDELYMSIAAANVALPTDPTKWAKLPTPALIQKQAFNSAYAGGTGNAITASFSPALAAYPAAPEGLTVLVRATAANTSTTPSFAPDGLAAKTIIKEDNRPLMAGDIVGAGYWMTLRYDASLDKWVLLNPANRTKLTADRNYYVRTDGNDSNTGLANTAGGAFLTRQRAIDVVARTIDLNGFNVIINVADGAYTGTANVDCPWVGDGTVFMTGNSGTPANCTVTTSNNDCFSCDNGGQLYVTGFKCSTTGSGANFRSYTHGNLSVNNCDHGVCAGSHHECGSGGTIGIYGAPKISGGAVSHLHCGSFGRIFSDVAVATAIPSAVAFSSYFTGAAEGGTIVVPGLTFTGAGVAGVTGQRYVVHKGAFVQAAPIANAFPGNSAGRTATGGVYKGSVTDPWQIMPDTGVNDSVVMYSLDTSTGTYTARFQVDATPGGKGYFFANGDNCYSSGRTYFGNTVQVVVASGTADGFSLESQTNLASGFSPFASSANNAACGYLRRRSSNGDILGFYRDTTSVGSISVTTTNTAYNTSSDGRLKDEVEDLAGSGDFIDGLRPRSYRWKIDGSRGAGFIAAELQTVSPSSVTGEQDAEDKDGNPLYQSVFYGSPEIIANLVAELQSLRKRVAALEAKL